MSVLRWEEPPTTGFGGPQSRVDWRSIAEELRANPARWALVHVTLVNTCYTTMIGRAGIRAFQPAGAFEAVTRRHSGGVHVYARYVGES